MKKLTKTQKKKNAAMYRKIKKEYNKIVDRLEIEHKKAPITYVQFKNRVLSRKEANDISLKEAIKKEANTETFIKPGERAKTNFISMLKDKHTDDWKELKKLSRDEHGRFKKIDLSWNKDQKVYTFSGWDKESGTMKEYYIDITNSPETVEIKEAQ